MDLSLLNIPNAKIKQLENKGIYSMIDLLKYVPTKYYDFREITKIKDVPIKEKEMCAFIGKVIEKNIYGNGKVLVVKIKDDTGTMMLTWFNKTNIINRIIQVNQEYIFCGQPYMDKNYHNVKKMSPILFNINKTKYQKLIPVYKKIKGMSDDYLKELIGKALFFTEKYEDFISEDILNDFNLIGEYEAFKKIHNPKTNDDIVAAKNRFIFDDLFIWNFILKSQQSTNLESYFEINSCKDWTPIYKNLPFDLTIDQKKTIKNIYYMMKSKKRVNALIQGDVGSGKTIVAEFLLSTCAENNVQCCLIAPTEVLAKQHYIEICERFKPLGYSIEYLSGATKTKERKDILNKLKNGDIQIIIGTHAIMGHDVVFKNLGMIVCDEEHRFGVNQREFFRRTDDYYIENLPYVSEINKYLKKLKSHNANILFRDIDLNNINIDKELQIYKDIDTKNRSPVEIFEIVKSRLEETLAYRNQIREASKDTKYLTLSKDLTNLISEGKSTTKLFKNLTTTDLYCLYYVFTPDVEIELAKEHPVPHQIIMSATPIPRTLAMSIYGDDVAVFTIKSKPNGRKPIITRKITDDYKINSMILEELNKGHQAYIVCPLIEKSESEKMIDVESVTAAYQRYKNTFSNHKVGMINGDMKQDEINRILKKYIDKELDILVSTTIIEVGVNNPNSTIMVILSSDRFGLSSLHQIRGRVGRNDLQSYCILKPNNSNDRKAQIMCSTTDGFKISKADMEMRGIGDFIGTKQSGKNKYAMLMLAYPNLYERISKLNDKIYANPDLLNKYKFLLKLDLRD